MIYDFSGPWINTCGHHAQLFTPREPHNDAARTSGDSAVHYLISKGLPSRKILLGIPTYGRSFLGSPKVGDRYIGHGDEGGTFEYKVLPRRGATVYFDETIGAVCSVGGDGGFVTCKNTRSVHMKAQYAKQESLRGFFHWTATGDTNHGNSLVEAGYQSSLGS